MYGFCELESPKGSWRRQRKFELALVQNWHHLCPSALLVSSCAGQATSVTCERKEWVHGANLCACEKTTTLSPAQSLWWPARSNLRPPVARVSDQSSCGVLEFSPATQGWIIPLDPSPSSRKESLLSSSKYISTTQASKKPALPLFFFFFLP